MMRKTKPMGLRTASATMASVVTLGTVPFVMAPAASAQQQCTPIHVVTTLGTGGSWSDKSTDPTEGVAPGYNITQELKDQYGADKVSGWNTNYPASVGAVSMFWGLLGMPGGKEQVSFGKSIQDGVQKTDAHISKYKSACPNSKFVLIGYSQGASVAGDVARDISAGKVAGVSADDVTNVLLIADPGRASNSAYESYTGKPSTLYGPIPPGVMGKNFEIISPGSDARSDRIGWTGERPGRFDGMYGKVLSLCAEDDLACSAPPHSFLRSLADYAMKESQVASFDSSLGDRIQKAVNHFTNSGGIQAAQSGDMARVQQLLNEAAVKANLTIADIPAGIALVKEISDLFNKINQECGAVDVGDVVKSVFVYLVPTLIENNLNVGGLQALWGQIPNEFKGMANDAVRSFTAGIPILGDMVKSVDDIFKFANRRWAKPAINWLLKGVHKIVGKPIYDWIGKSLGMDPRNNDLTTFGQQIAFLGGFPVAHGSYWNSTEINGKKAADYGRDWIKESVGNALAGKSYTASPKARNLTDANLEKPLESQTGADGKVICNPKDLDTGIGSDKGDTGSGETKPNPSQPGAGDKDKPAQPTTGKDKPAQPTTGKDKPAQPTTGNKPAPTTGKDKPAPTTGKDKPAESAAPTAGKDKPGTPAPGTKQPSTSEPSTPVTTAPEKDAEVPTPGENGGKEGNETTSEAVVPPAPSTVAPTTVNEVDTSVTPTEAPAKGEEQNRGLLATTGANVLGLLALASGLILLAAAVLVSRRKA